MKSAGKARNNGLYRHIRTSKEIIRNLLNDYVKKSKQWKDQIQQNKTSQKPFSDGKGKGADPVHADPGIHSKKSKNNSPRRNSFRKNIVDGMALEKEKQEINNVKYIKGNQDAQKSFLIIFCEAEVLLRGIGETGTG